MNNPKRNITSRLLLVALLLIALLTSTLSPAQKIYFTDTTNVWIETDGCNNPEAPPSMSYTCYTKYYYAGDTLANGLRYLFMYKKGVCVHTYGTFIDNPQKIAAVREDTVAKRVYALIYGTISATSQDTSEIILYDYNKQTGDTIAIQSAALGYSYTVYQVDSLQLNGVLHKKWFLFFDVFPFEYIVEGIGSLTYPLQPRVPHFDSEFCSYGLLCFHNKSTIHIAGDPQWYNPNCFLLDVKDSISKSPKLSVRPNPATDEVTFQYESNAQFEVSIFDITGRIVKKDRGNGGRLTIAVVDLPAGLYLYQVRIKEHSFTGKIVKQ